MPSKRLKQAGFTLLELLVVIVIIGLLAGYVAPRYFSQVGKSEVQVARAQIDALEKALDQYRLEKRRYPTAEEGLAAVQPYMKKTLPNDPWGHPYVYRAGVESNSFSYAAAIGLFEAVIGLVLITSANTLSRRTVGTSLW